MARDESVFLEDASARTPLRWRACGLEVSARQACILCEVLQRAPRGLPLHGLDGRDRWSVRTMVAHGLVDVELQAEEVVITRLGRKVVIALDRIIKGRRREAAPALALVPPIQGAPARARSGGR